MTMKGLLFEWEWCTGCQSCEIACKHEKGLGIGDWGVKIAQLKPFQHASGEWEWIYMPILTKECDLCAERVADGTEVPACVLHCLGGALHYGTLDELAKLAEQKGEGKYAILLPNKAE